MITRLWKWVTNTLDFYYDWRNKYAPIFHFYYIFIYTGKKPHKCAKT